MQREVEMNNYIADRSSTMSGYIFAAINAMENSVIRMKYYRDTNEPRFLKESKDWIDVANIYMREIDLNNEDS